MGYEALAALYVVSILKLGNRKRFNDSTHPDPAAANRVVRPAVLHGFPEMFSNFVLIPINCWFSHDVTKIQTLKLLILLIFYFHDV